MTKQGRGATYRYHGIHTDNPVRMRDHLGPSKSRSLRKIDKTRYHQPALPERERKKRTVSASFPDKKKKFGFDKKFLKKKKKLTMVNMYFAAPLAGPSATRLAIKIPISTTAHIACTIWMITFAFLRMPTFTILNVCVVLCYPSGGVSVICCCCG